MSVLQGVCVQSLQHCNTATHCNTLQHTATHCNTLQITRMVPHRTWLLVQCPKKCVRIHYNTLQHNAMHFNTHTHGWCVCTLRFVFLFTATYCNTPHHTATHCTTVYCTTHIWCLKEHGWYVNRNQQLGDWVFINNLVLTINLVCTI